MTKRKATEIRNAARRNGVIIAREAIDVALAAIYRFTKFTRA